MLGGPGYALLTTARARDAAPEVVEAAATVVEVAPGRVDELAGELLGDDRAGPHRRARRRPGGRRREGARRRLARRGAGDGDPDDALRRRDDARAPPGRGRARGRRQRAPGGGGQRPGAVGLPARAGAGRQRAQRARPRRRGPVHAARQPGLDARGARGGAADRRRLAAHRRPGPRRAGARPRCWPATRSTRPSTACTTCSRRRSCGSAGVGHGPANAIMLPHTLGALAWRFPAWIERLGEAMGGDPAEVAARLCALTGATTLGELGVDAAALDACADAAAERPELDLTPPRADRAELRALYGDALLGLLDLQQRDRVQRRTGPRRGWSSGPGCAPSASRRVEPPRRRRRRTRPTSPRPSPSGGGSGRSGRSR